MRLGSDRPVNHPLSSPHRLHGVGEKIAPAVTEIDVLTNDGAAG